MKNVLVVGGTSGLGLEIALRMDGNILVTGRNDFHHEKLRFLPCDLGNNLPESLTALVSQIDTVETLVYAAGFWNEGEIAQASDSDILRQVNVGLVAPAMLLQRLLKKQASLPGFIAITSTSQWTPRRLEPLYTATKAGLAMLANSISLGDQIGKTLVAAPAGMATPFWRSYPEKDVSAMLNPTWVAEQILKLYSEAFKYQFARIMRQPPRVEIVETR